MIHFRLFHHDDLFHDFGVDHDVFRQQDAAAFQIGASLHLEETHVVLAGNPFEFIHDIGCEERFCQKAVHTDMKRFIHDFIPVE